MANLTVQLTGIAMLCSSLSVFAAPAPIDRLVDQTFVLNGETFQAKLALSAGGVGKIWRPDGYSTVQWDLVGDNLSVSLDSPLETPYPATDTQGNPVDGVARLETLTLAFADAQILVADVKESYRDVFPPSSGLPDQLEDYDNAGLSLVNYSSIKQFNASSGQLVALPFSSEQSAIIRLADAAQAILVEDPLNKTPSTFAWNATDSLTLSPTAGSSIRYSIFESSGLSALLLAEVKVDGNESIFLSSGGIVDSLTYETPASISDFSGSYTIPEFKGTTYDFGANGLGKVTNQNADGTLISSYLTWGIQNGTVFGHRWTQLFDGQPSAVSDPVVAQACETGTAVCEISQLRNYRILAKTADQLLVLRTLDQKTSGMLSTWIHVFNRSVP